MPDKNNIEKQFNMAAEEYDVDRRRSIPCYDDFYINTTELIAADIDAPERIIDLGAGTGLLSEHWYRHFPDAEYILTDIALWQERRKLDRECSAGQEINMLRKSGSSAVECVY